MVAGHLREIKGRYYIVLSYKDLNGKRHTPTRATGLAVRGNKKKAEQMLIEARIAMTEQLNTEKETYNMAHPEIPSVRGVQIREPRPQIPCRTDIPSGWGVRCGFPYGSRFRGR